eukprot:8878863-Prorocentrum_lima.AAC.1
MTSSLVGSEMCIRDREGAGAREGEREGSRNLQQIMLKVKRVRKKSTPVSYTHLTLPTICSV